MRFDLTDLKLFLQVVETGSITHGAARANMALPSASARLRGMEELIGHPLLERGRRGVEPTPAGDTLAHHARLVLRQIDIMHGELGEFGSGLRGSVRLLANTAATTEFLPAALAPWLAAHPNVDIDLKERPSTDIVKAVAGGFADLGVIFDIADSGALQLRPFAIDRLVLAVPADHAFARRRKIAFAEAASQCFIGLTAGSPLQEHLDGIARQAGLTLSFRIRLRTFDAICRMVEGGAGVAVLPETAARKAKKSMKLALLSLTDRWAVRHLSLCSRNFDALPFHTRDLANHLTGSAPCP